MANKTYSISSQDAMFKNMYASNPDLNALVNTKTPLASILMKNKKVDFVGKNFVQPVPFNVACGLGYRAAGQNLPSAIQADVGEALFPAKRAYGVQEYDREAIIASRNNEGAFAKATVVGTKSLVEGFQLHMVERALFGNGSGKLGELSATATTGTGTVADPWVMTLTTTGTNAPKYKKRYFPKNAKLDLYTSGGVYQMTVQVVSAGATTLSAITVATGSAASPTSGDLFYWEGNRNGEIVGLNSLIATSTLYNINQTNNPEFKGLTKTISGALQYDDLNDAISDLEEESESPNLAVTSHKGIALLKNLSEDAKRYSASEVKSSNGLVGFKGIEMMSEQGAFACVASQMCPDDEIWLINTNYMQIVMRQDFGFFDDDGTILMRDPNKDVLNARYGGYFELFCSKPNTVEVVKGFTV